MTQNDAILDALRQRGSLTPLEALQDFGCFRLAARIRDLRVGGYLIINEGETRNGKHYAKYVLHETHQLTLDEVR